MTQKVINRLLQTFAPRTSWWQSVSGKTPIIVYQPKKAVDNILSTYTNLANPGTLDLVGNPLHAPMWDATNGWKFDSASSQYLCTNEVTPITITENFTMIVRYSNYVDGGTATTSRIISSSSCDFSLYIQDNPMGSITTRFTINDRNPQISGYVVSQIIAGDKNGLYEDGTLVYDMGTPPASFSNAGAIYIATNYDGGFFVQFCTFYVQAVAVYDVTLSGAEIATLTTAMAAI